MNDQIWLQVIVFRFESMDSEMMFTSDKISYTKSVLLFVNQRERQIQEIKLFMMGLMGINHHFSYSHSPRCPLVFNTTKWYIYLITRGIPVDLSLKVAIDKILLMIFILVFPYSFWSTNCWHLLNSINWHQTISQMWSMLCYVSQYHSVMVIFSIDVLITQVQLQKGYHWYFLQPINWF